MPKTVFLTGGSRGIGQAVCEKYRKEGYEVLSPSRVDVDLASSNEIVAYLNKCTFNADILINNAAENQIFPLENLSLAVWEKMQMVNLTAPFLFIKHFAKKMAQNKWGRIVNVSSCFSIVSREGRSAYSASKAGLNGLTRTAALEYAEAGVLINAVCPGFVETDLTRKNNTPVQIEAIKKMVPLKRLAAPSEIASVIYFLCSEENKFITGQTVVIDGGFTIQ